MKAAFKTSASVQVLCSLRQSADAIDQCIQQHGLGITDVVAKAKTKLWSSCSENAMSCSCQSDIMRRCCRDKPTCTDCQREPKGLFHPASCLLELEEGTQSGAQILLACRCQAMSVKMDDNLQKRTVVQACLARVRLDSLSSFADCVLQQLLCSTGCCTYASKTMSPGSCELSS